MNELSITQIYWIGFFCGILVMGAVLLIFCWRDYNPKDKPKNKDE